MWGIAFHSLLLAFGLLLLLGTTGCNSLRGYPKRPVKENTELQHLLKYFSEDVLKEYDDMATAPAGQTDPQITARRREYRDRVVFGRMRAYELGFQIFEKAIYIEKNMTTIITDWTALGVAGYGTVGGGVATKAILHAISGGLTGARMGLDKAAYYEKTMPVLLAQMEASRTQMAANIRQALTQSPAQYSLAAALQDVDTYYKVGTIPGAIIAINKTAGADGKAADKDMKDVLTGSFQKDDAGMKLRQWVVDPKDNKKYIPEHEQSLKKWLEGKKLDVDIGPFLNMKNFADERAQAVKDLIDK